MDDIPSLRGDPEFGAAHSAEPEAARLPEGRRIAWKPPWIGSVHHRLQIDVHWFTVTLAMLAVGLMFFGWRGAMGVSATVAAALSVHGLIVWIRTRTNRWTLVGRRVPHLHALNLAMLLGLSMPVMGGVAVPLAAGAVLGVVMHLVGRAHRLRVHPVVIVLLLVWLVVPMVARGSSEAWQHALQPVGSVLRPQRLVIGDVADATVEASITPWWSPVVYEAPDALRRHDGGRLVLSERMDLLADRQHLIARISGGELVRLEELFIGAHPDAIGASSRGLLLFLGFYLMYRRLASWKVAAAAGLAALAVLLLLPVHHDGGWTSVFARLMQLGPAASAVYIAYFLFATPLALMVMVLAPGSMPMSRAGRLVYAAVLGGGGAAAMWYLPAPQAAFLGLLAAGLLVRPLDALKRSSFVRGNPG